MDGETESLSPLRDRLREGLEEFEGLLAELEAERGNETGETPAPLSIAEKIHAIRKLGKSLRGGLALVGLRNTAGRQVQAVGRLLSASRDAVARRKTWNRLEWDARPETAAAIASLLEQETECHRPPPETLAWCLARAAEAREMLAALDGESMEGEAAKSLAKLRRKLKKHARRLADSAEREMFHETRKALKAYLGALKYLPDAEQADSSLDDLADLLGDENDIATLSVWLDDHGFTARLEPALRKDLRKRGEKLRRKAAKAAAKLFP